MAGVIKRRSPLVISPPKSTAGPNRWIPKIRICVGRSLLPLACVVSIHPPHQLQPAPTNVRPKIVKVIGNTYNRPALVNNVKLVRNNLPRVKGRAGRVLLTDYRREGKVYRIYPKKPTIVGPVWPTWQDPINAGYPLYFEPGPNVPGTYEEVFDFGTIFNSVIVNTDWNLKNQVGTVSITETIAVSTDNITYDTPLAGTSRFAATMRYVKIKLTFTPTDKKSGVNLYNLNVTLSVHRETDAGSLSALSTDGSGTVVTFNKAFKAIDGLALTVQTNNSWKAVYANLSISGFNVYVFDDTGVRKSATVTWVARGIL